MFYYRNTKDPKDHPPEALKQKIESSELGDQRPGFLFIPGSGVSARCFFECRGLVVKNWHVGMLE